MSRHFVIGTAGHVDHGKSALVKALTGTDPDRLPEEKARGITIDLGFAHFVLNGTGSRGDLRVGIVDVPGHEDFVKNMVAGVGAIDLALLVIAADDGWMPQTEEHLQILTYLRVPQAIVALTKIDVVPGREASCLEAARGKLRETPFADAPIVCTSTVSGHGLDQLKTTIAATLEKMEPSPDLGKPRLPVDRVFTLRGVGVVVTGTLSGGSLRRGDLVTVQPGGHRARIRSLQNHNEEIDAATPGMRTALNLPDLRPHNEPGGRGGGGSTVERGDVLTDSQPGEASSTIDVLLERSARLIDLKTVLPPLKHEKRVRVHHGSGNVPARVLLNCPQLNPGESALAQLQLDRPLLGFVGDRFIIRDWAEQRTLGGGIILDADAARGAFRNGAQQKLLATRAADSTATTLIASQLERDGVVERSRLLIKSHFSTAKLDAAIRELAGKSMIIEIGTGVADAHWWTQLTGTAAETVDRWHAEQPQQPGLPLNALRSIIERDERAAGRFEAIVAELSRHGFEQVGTHMRRKTHRPALPGQLQAAGGKMRTALQAKPLEPPSRKELTTDPAAQQALRFLVNTGEAVEIGSELVLLAEACEQARALVREFLTRHHSATVSELRQALGTNRRVIVPLLEYFDRVGLTRRIGDKRVLREPA